MPRFHHLYDNVSKNQVTPRVLTIAIERDEDTQEVHFGLAICKPTTVHSTEHRDGGRRSAHCWEEQGDQFNKKRGNAIAGGRLQAFKRGREVVSHVKVTQGVEETPLFLEANASVGKVTGTPLAGSVMVGEDDDTLVAVLDWIVRNFPDGHIVRMSEGQIDTIIDANRRRTLVMEAFAAAE